MDSDGFCGFQWIVVVYSGWQPKNIGSFQAGAMRISDRLKELGRSLLDGGREREKGQ